MKRMLAHRPVSSGTIWDSVASFHGWVYSNAHLTRNNSTGSTSSGIATNSLSGKWIFGYVDAVGNTHLESVGIATASFNNANYCGATTASYGLISGGNGVFNNGAGVSYSGTPNYGAGDTVYIAYDASAHLIWWKKGALGTWSGTSGNPATGTGGLSVTSATYFPSGGDQSGNTTTWVFGTNIPSAAIPSGFTALVYEESIIICGFIRLYC